MYEGISWLVEGQYNDETQIAKYVNSLYFALTTMTSCGYGDIHPTSSGERCIAMIAMLTSSGIFAFVIEEIGKIVSNYNVLAA
jgi:hyperpolarization activated cyclic nucleotide-gated potassium channel 2